MGYRVEAKGLFYVDTEEDTNTLGAVSAELLLVGQVDFLRPVQVDFHAFVARLGNTKKAVAHTISWLGSLLGDLLNVSSLVR